jgi:hypothetical protein
MRLRNLITATGAVLAAGALALAPTAAHAAGPIASLDLGTSANPTTAVLKGPASVTMKVYGSDMKLNCSSGSASAAWNTGAAATAPLTFSALTLNCDSFLPGTTVTLQLVCNMPFNPDASNSVTNDKTDVITGSVNAGANCVKVTVTGGCTLYINGATTASLDENKKVVGSTTYNEFTVSGSGFKIATSPAPTFACLGAVSGGSAVTLNNVKFNLRSNVNFRP